MSNRRTALALTVTAVLITVFCANALEAGARIFKSNVLTAKHVIVSGTHVAVIPPPGATPATEFFGFQLTSRGITLRIVEKMGVPYSASEGTLTAEGLEADDIKLLDKSPVTLNEKPATLIAGTFLEEETGETQQNGSANAAETSVWLLVLGNDNLTTYIYGYYPTNDKSAASTLRTSIFSVVLEPKQGENSSGGYSLSTSGTSLKFYDEAASARYYTVDGAPKEGELKNALYTAARSSQSVPLPDRTDFAERAMERYMSAYDEYTISSRGSVNYDGLSGIEMVADLNGIVRRSRTSSGAVVKRTMPAKAYQTILFDNNGNVYTFSGIAVRDADSYLRQFRQITSSFKLTKK
ncbi:MAG: hypothetical protein LBT08_06210 [Synergistaceae bacterium]|nr:hypothetical protein [Synergistaceae bacterium]